MLGFETNDDAAVVRLDEDRAILQTVDFFTPIVDDAYDFGRIAAANALSDIYAMGGEPLCAMNLLAFPCSLPPEIVAAIVRGGAEVCAQAGAPVVGGHTIDDEEPKFGLSVTGCVDPDRILYNAGARPGDLLVLTKPLGTGLIGTALKREALAEDDADARAAIESMARLNREAARAACDLNSAAQRLVHACTDVSGFGLAGHAHEMAQASDCAVRLQTGDLPLLPRARELAAAGIMPGKTDELIAWAAGFLADATGVSEGGHGRTRTPESGSGDEHSHERGDEHAPEHERRDAHLTTRRLICDPQTSGGLLLALDPAAAPRYLAAVDGACVVGEFVEGASGQVILF